MTTDYLLIMLRKYVVFRSEKGEVRIGIRRLVCQPCSIPQSMISSQSMHLGVLATASHAVATQTMLVVYYKPRFLLYSPLFIKDLNSRCLFAMNGSLGNREVVTM